MERLNDVMMKRLQWYNTNPNYGLVAHLKTPSVPEDSHRTTFRPKLGRVNKKVIKNRRTKIANVQSKDQNRRQFLRPGIGNRLRQRPGQPSMAGNALQMSLLLLSVLAFGIFATTSIMMRNNRRNNRREQSVERIIIDKASRIGDKESSSTTSYTSLSFTYWVSVFMEHLWEYISDFVREL